jgi:AcrR family transcriptional regulator
MVAAMTGRLDRDAWTRAALAAFERGGPAEVAVVPLARRLGVTRGSFYWHFESRDELLTAALELWEREHSDAVLEALQTMPDPRARLQALGQAATRKPPSIFIQLLRAADDPAVAHVLERASQSRLEVLAEAYRDAGLPPATAQRRALIAYAQYVGLAFLLAEDPGLLPDERARAAYARELSAVLATESDT